MSLKVGVLASGAGSNLQALIDQVHGRDGIEIVAVGSDKPDAQALKRAGTAGIASRVFETSAFGDNRGARDLAMADWLSGLGVDLVVLAGYMQLVSPPFLEAFENRVINVHPALLPAFPGLDAVGQALAYGVKVFGVTIHFVDAGVDSGPIILQRAVELPGARTREQVFAVLHELEHQLLPEVVHMFGTGRVSIDEVDGRQVVITA